MYVIVTERHESRRVDNQLRGGAGRQSDPSSTRFFFSLGDNLLRIFGANRVVGLTSSFCEEKEITTTFRQVNPLTGEGPEEIGVLTLRHPEAGVRL